MCLFWLPMKIVGGLQSCLRRHVISKHVFTLAPWVVAIILFPALEYYNLLHNWILPETHKGLKHVTVICLLCPMLMNILFHKYIFEARRKDNWPIKLRKWWDVILVHGLAPAEKNREVISNNDSDGLWKGHLKVNAHCFQLIWASHSASQMLANFSGVEF